ncbi:unnamed protein product [Allacma fusca]|uniref:Mediator of RNA polymerase II transcription subunit 8 n=1 Tax=Allacma fusca TaxID=39272 RepID=A0A8J2JVL0_9HEXA|nr:unnamed protein product [Allacma fusca]
MLQRVNEMKSSINTLVLKLEHDHRNISSPVFLDSFSVVSGQMNSLMRLLRSDKVPPLKGLTVLPLSLNPEKDPALLNTTEGRLEVFNHEVVPDYLRTKPDPDVEAKHDQVEHRSSQVNQDVIAKQAASLTKMANHVVDLISSTREEWEASERTGLPVTTSDADTQELVSSLYTGKAFKSAPIPRQSSSQSPAAASPPVQPTSKAPGIKTNIKSASASGYNR